MSISENFTLFCPKGMQINMLRKLQKTLHFSLPIGVFWDIETCGVPKRESAFALVQKIREKFFESHREVEFVCVCDVKKQNKNVIKDLVFAQVTVVHVSGNKKNGACDKIKQYIKRFVDNLNGASSTLLLISENVNIFSELSNFRYRDKTRIILIHRGLAHQSLLVCADEHYKFSAIASDVLSKFSTKLAHTPLNLLLVKNLPMNLNTGKIICILRKLSRNYGGRVFKVKEKCKAFIHFSTLDASIKAQKQMHKQCVHGKEISVNFYCGIQLKFSFSTSPFKISKIQTSSVSSGSRLSSYSTRRENNAFKTHTRDPSCSKFDLSRIIPLMYNGTDNLNEPIVSYIPKAAKTSSMSESFVSLGFEGPFVHNQPDNLPLDLKCSVTEKFDSMRFETPSICDLHCAKNSLFDLKAVEENLTFSNHALGLVISVGERSLKTTEVLNSFGKSPTHIIPASEIPSNFPPKSPLMSPDKNRNFNPEVEMPTFYKKDSSKKCFPYDPSKFEMKQSTQFENSSIGLLKETQDVHPVHCHLNFCTELDQNPVQVESIKSTLTSEKKQGRRIRIAARFTVPINN